MSNIESVSGAQPHRRRMARWAEIWRECAYSQRRLAELHQSQTADQPLRWKQTSHGWTLIGSVIPPSR